MPKMILIWGFMTIGIFDLGRGAGTHERAGKKIYLIEKMEVFGLLSLCHLSNTHVQVMFYNCVKLNNKTNVGVQSVTMVIV